MTGRTTIPPGITTVATIHGLSRYSYGLFVPQFQRAFPDSVAVWNYWGQFLWGLPCGHSSCPSLHCPIWA